MLRSGLVSITFRQLSPEQIVELVAKAGLEAIEWGGDVHVPHGDLDRAAAVGRMTRDAGLAVASYGSYYRVGDQEPVAFDDVLQTAVELGAPLTRVWAGDKGSAEADDEYRGRIVAESRRIANLALSDGLFIAYEAHANSLTDTSASARRLLEAVDHENVKTYWQATVGMTSQRCLEGLRAVAPWLANVHAFTWAGRGESLERRALAEGEDPWRAYLAEAAAAEGDRFVMLEFVRDDEPEQFLADAETLKRWLAEVNADA